MLLIVHLQNNGLTIRNSISCGVFYYLRVILRVFSALLAAEAVTGQNN